MTTPSPDDKPRITAKIAGRPLQPLLLPFVVGYFLAALACDFIYVQSSASARYLTPEFASITVWLLGFGLVSAVACGAAALTDLMGERRFRDLPDLGLYLGGNVLLVVVQAHNLALRQAHGTDAINPMGLILSLLAVAVLIATPSQNWARLYRQAR
jgi:uncharacterized membrane protein